MLAKLRVRELEDGHRSQRHHVKARKRNHSYPLHGNLPPSFIETALFCAAVDFAVSSDRLGWKSRPATPSLSASRTICASATSCRQRHSTALPAALASERVR